MMLEISTRSSRSKPCAPRARRTLGGIRGTCLVPIGRPAHARKVPHCPHSVMSQARPESKADGPLASAGFWRHDGPLGYGKLCFACPDGAECEVLFPITLCEMPLHLNRLPVLQGKAALPFPKPDFWAATNAQTNGTLMIHDSPGVDAILEDPPYFLPCSSGRCKGNFQCQPGYTGVQCSVCEPGQFFFQGKCDISCADIEPKAVVTVFGIGAVVCVWLILNFVPSKSAHLCCAAPRMFGVVHPVMLRGPTVRSASLCRRFPSLNVGVS